jgi:hypothetical protein
LDSLDDLLDEGTRHLIEKREAHQESVAQAVESNILRAQAKQKKDYRRRHHGPKPEDLMPEGCLVLLWCPPKTKMHRTSAIEGPYRLVQYISSTQALIEEGQGKRWPVAIKRLSPYPGNV